MNKTLLSSHKSSIVGYLPLSVAVALTASAFFCGCTPVQRNDTAGNDAPTVLVSIPPLEYFADEIGGDRINVECLAPASTDPETFEPTIAALRKASQAKVFLTTGLMPFEQRTATSISASNPEMKICNLSDSINLITGTHGHDEADPHIWASLRNARIMARQTCRTLSEAIPADSSYFNSRLSELESHLDSLDKATAERLAPLAGKSFLIWHPSLSYFARDYGLIQHAVGHEHKESSMTGLKKRLEKASHDNAMIFFYQKEFDSRQSEAIRQATGLYPTMLSPMSADIESTVIQAADAILNEPAKAKAPKE